VAKEKIVAGGDLAGNDRQNGACFEALLRCPATLALLLCGALVRTERSSRRRHSLLHGDGASPRKVDESEPPSIILHEDKVSVEIVVNLNHCLTET
jgi:hypothetical protein